MVSRPRIPQSFPRRGPHMDTTDPYSRKAGEGSEPPTGFRATLRHLGPGMIVVGSVVGSGELIVTTKLGALAGFVLLWFVLLSCFVKVVVQAELARYTIASGRTFLRVFNTLPGPAAPRPAWLTLPWMAVLVLACVAAVAIFVRLDERSQTTPAALLLCGAVVLVCAATAWIAKGRRTAARNAASQQPALPMNWFTWLWLASTLLVFVNAGAILGGTGQVLEMAFPGVLGEGGARYWSILIAILCGALLLGGTYGSLEKLLIVLVAVFTVLTVACTVLLQWTGFAVGWSDLAQGLSLNVPGEISTPLVLTALAMYAGTGVAFGEMWNYTYWCLEKGYARNAGPPEPGNDWPRRAKGWIRVMYTDVGLTMVVYTVSTVCFYLLGAAILYANQLNPDGRDTIVTLSSMYTESFGDWAATLFLVGSFFVLFTTVLSGAAANSRLLADALGIIGIIDESDYAARLRFIRVFVVVSLAAYSIAYWLFENPPQMLLITSSLIAAVMYPILGLGTLYLRYRRVDPRIAPGSLTTGWLWICAIALAIISPAGILIVLAINSGWVTFG